MRLILPGLILLFLASSPAWACKCAPPTQNASCTGVPALEMYSGFTVRILHLESYWHTLLADLLRPHGMRGIQAQVIHTSSPKFRVGDSIRMQTGHGGGDCGVPFQVDEVWQVTPTERTGGILHVSICSARILHFPVRTKAHAEAVKQGAVWSRVEGSVAKSHQPVTVRLKGVTGAKPLSAETRTASKGEFEFDNLPAGRYRLAAQIGGKWVEEPEFSLCPASVYLMGFHAGH